MSKEIKVDRVVKNVRAGGNVLAIWDGKSIECIEIDEGTHRCKLIFISHP